MIALRVIGGIVLLFFARWGLDSAIHIVRIAPSAIELRGRQALYKVIQGVIFSLGMAFLLCWLAVIMVKPGVIISWEWIVDPWIILGLGSPVWSWVTKNPHTKGKLRVFSWEIWILLVIFMVLAQVQGYYWR